MSTGEYLGGLACLAAVLAGNGGAAWLLVSRRLAWMATEARVVAWALLTTAAVAFSHLLPLILGVLTRGTAVATSLAILLAMSRVPPSVAAAHEPHRGRSSGRWEWLLAGAACVFAGAYVLAFLRVNRSVAISDIDSTGFHLPVVARWIQTGSVWRLDDFVFGWAFGAYPQTGNLLQTAVVLPWRDDFLLRAVGPTFLLLCAVGVYALATEMGARRAPAAAFGALAPMFPAATSAGLDHGQTDAIMAAGFICGVLFLARHARTARREELLLAGVGFGIAFGTKWYGPPEVAAVLLVWLGAHLLGRRGTSRPLRDAFLVAGAAAVVGGFWLVRNLVEADNPVFPARVGAFGLTIFHGANAFSGSDLLRPSVLDYITDLDVLRSSILPQYVTQLSLAGAVLVGGLILAAVVALLTRSRAALTLAVGSIAVLAVYTALPLTASGTKGHPSVGPAARYATPGLLMAAAASAWVVSRWNSTALAAGALALAGLAHAVSRYDLLSSNYEAVTARQVVVAILGLGIMAAVAFVLVRRRPPRRTLAAAAALVAVAGVVAGRKIQTDFDAVRYRGVGEPFDWIADRSGEGIRVGLAGSTGREPYSSPYLAFGPRLRNSVEYVGERRDHLLVRAPRDRFLEGLSAGGYDALLVGQLGNARREAAWARSVGWTVVATDEVFTLLTAPGRPAGT